MAVTVYGDESGIHRRRSPCYAIGCVVVDESSIAQVDVDLRAILTTHGVSDELKWSKIGSYRARSEAALAGVAALLQDGVRFSAIVVDKRRYAKWSRDREDAFYHTYFQIVRHIARTAEGPIDVLLDQRHDRYPRRTEVLELVTNRALAKIGLNPSVARVDMVDSREHIILQFTDILVGAITSATGRYLDSDFPMNDGKLALDRDIASLVGWPSLCHDSYPYESFNGWHFPIEFRGQPQTLPVRVKRSG